MNCFSLVTHTDRVRLLSPLHADMNLAMALATCAGCSTGTMCFSPGIRRSSNCRHPAL